MSFETKKIMGIVLAGGESRRMENKDKGLMKYRAKPLVEHVLTRLSGQIGNMVISANRNIDQYKSFGYPVISDQQQSNETNLIYQGPMAGVVSCIQSFRTESPTFEQVDYVALSSCDTPHIPLNLVEQLWLALHSEASKAVAVANDGQRPQALHCLIRKEYLGDLIDAYERGERSLHRWQQSKAALNVDFSAQAHLFYNINTLAQLEN